MIPRRPVTIVVRSCGERTEEACLSIARDQNGAEDVVLVRETPFGAAVRQTFHVGIERRTPWTLAVDADVLLAPGVVDALIAWADMHPARFFVADLTVADKLLGQLRPAGVHLYRTEWLSTALAHARTIDDHQRPESLVRARMVMDGYSALQVTGWAVGLHDFEQSYRDIYRTAYTHALKHPQRMIAPCSAAWRRLEDRDPDFRVAQIALAAARASGEAACIDHRHFPMSIAHIPGLRTFAEKPPLPESAWCSDRIAQRLGAFAPFAEVAAVRDMTDNARRMLGVTPERDDQDQGTAAQVTGRRLSLMAIGVLLRSLGNRIIQAARRR